MSSGIPEARRRTPCCHCRRMATWSSDELERRHAARGSCPVLGVPRVCSARVDGSPPVSGHAGGRCRHRDGRLRQHEDGRRTRDRVTIDDGTGNDLVPGPSDPGSNDIARPDDDHLCGAPDDSAAGSPPWAHPPAPERGTPGPI